MRDIVPLGSGRPRDVLSLVQFAMLTPGSPLFQKQVTFSEQERLRGPQKKVCRASLYISASLQAQPLCRIREARCWLGPVTGVRTLTLTRAEGQPGAALWNAGVGLQ